LQTIGDAAQVALNDNVLFDHDHDYTALDPRWNPMATHSIRGDVHHAIVVTLPDVGNLFSPMEEVIRGAAPEHMQQAAEEIGIVSVQLTHTLRTGVASFPAWVHFHDSAQVVAYCLTAVVCLDWELGTQFVRFPCKHALRR
jgi:hypothetical protein